LWSNSAPQPRRTCRGHCSGHRGVNQSAWTTTTPPDRLCRTASPRLATSRTSPAQLRSDHNIIDFLFTVLRFYTVNSGPRPHAITARGAVCLMGLDVWLSLSLLQSSLVAACGVVTSSPWSIIGRPEYSPSFHLYFSHDCVCQAARQAGSRKKPARRGDAKEAGSCVFVSSLLSRLILDNT